MALETQGIDRLYLNVYQPLPQTGAGACYFFKQHRGQPVASPGLRQQMSPQFVHNIGSFVLENGLDLVRFKKGERKDDETQRGLQASDDDPERVLSVGKAQEKNRAFRLLRRTHNETGESIHNCLAAP